MRYIKTYESIFDEVRKYLINKYIIVKVEGQGEYFLVEVKEEMITTEIMGQKFEKLVTKRLYTLKKDGTIKKNSKHGTFIVGPKRLEDIIVYYSDSLVKTFDVLKSIPDAKKYNL